MFMKTILFLILAMCGFSEELQLKRVILSANNNPMYIDLWPVVAPLWKKMGLQPTLALIADQSCLVDSSLGDVIRFDPIPSIPEALHTQAIRLLLPALFPEDGCLIADIDILPISRSYFFDGVKGCPDDSFLVYRDKNGNPEDSQYPMCYVAAKGSVFQSVFGVFSRDDFEPILTKWNNLGYGWFSDQLILYRDVNDWESRGGHVVRLGHIVGPRLDRAYWDYQLINLDISQYIDCHCPRPYLQYKQSIDLVADAIQWYWFSQNGE